MADKNSGLNQEAAPKAGPANDISVSGSTVAMASTAPSTMVQDQEVEITEDAIRRGHHQEQKPGIFTRLEAWVSRLSSRNTFWHRVCSLIWLPYAFWSGIKMRRKGPDAMTAVLPFRRFNRNWYNAMAGASLLGNSEIAGGMYVFGVCGGDYTVVCKGLNYKFLRPCLGPAVYRMTPREDIHEMLKTKSEFNITLDMQILQMAVKPGQKERRVGKCEVTFHVTPKAHVRQRRERLLKRGLQV